MADIIPNSAQGLALHASIQKQLVFHGWAADDDPVMAEYCVVMLGNRKTPDQISSELSDLIGSDFDSSFVTWLFAERDRHYPDPNKSAGSPGGAASPVAGEASSSNGQGDVRNERRSGPGGRAVFGAALSGVKRDSREMDSREPPQQRQRFDGPGAGRGGFSGVPSGPRSMNGAGGAADRGARNGPSGKSIFDRVQPGPPAINPKFSQPANTLGMPQAAFDAITQAINAVNNGAHPSALAAIPFPALAAHPHAAFLPPQILAQAQAAAMAQAQAFAAMQNVWSGAPNPAMQQGPFNPNAAPFAPGAQGFGGGPGQGPRGGRNGPPQQQQQQKPSTPAPVILPTKPQQEAICKQGVDCTKPPCPFSHPSPVATKDSGLVLSSEACEKQLKCEDPDCPKSHVSKAQKTAANSPAVKTTANGQQTYQAPAPAPRAPPVADPTSIPGAGEKPCKFAGACTRKGCVFLHPWDVRGDPSQAGAQVPCHWGAACTRADCHFAHPPNRPSPYSKSFNSKPAGGNAKYSATFNTPPAKNGSKAGDKIGAWPAEEKTHVSDRLKRFANAENAEGGEKIIPGEKNGGQEKVEIDVDDEDSPAKKPVEG